MTCVLCCDSVSEMRNGHYSRNSSCFVAYLITVTSQYKRQLTQDQVGWGSEQPDLVEDVPAHCKRA